MADTVDTSGSWWQQNAPSVRTLGSTPQAPTGGIGSLGNISNTPTGFSDQQITGMMNPGNPAMQPQQTQQQGGDPQALIQQYQQSHPPGDIAGLMSFLQQNGIQVTRPTHAGGTLQSDDKLVVNGQMIDFISDVGGANAKWQYSPEGQGGGDQGGAFGSLAQGWGQQYNAPSAEDAMNSPGIQAALKLGSQAIQRSAAAKGTLLTGGTLKDLTGFANDLGSQAYGDVWNRGMQQYQDAKNSFYTNQNNLFGRNFSLAQLGQNAASDQGMQGQNFANASSDLYGQQGNAQSAGTVAGTQAWMPTLKTGAEATQDIFGRTRSSY